MSDPVTNVEIEDVLSSIKRLVSQEQSRAPEQDAAPEPVEALVLTPDHRVDRVAKEAAASIAGTEDRRREAASAVRSELERAIEELEAAMGIEEEESLFPPEAEAEEGSDEDLDWEAPVGRAMDGLPPEPPIEAADPEPAPEPQAAAPESEVLEDHPLDSIEDAEVLEADPLPEADDITDPETAPRLVASSASERLHLVSSQDDVAFETGPYDESYDETLETEALTPQVEAALEDQADDFDEPQPPFDHSRDDHFPTGASMHDAYEAASYEEPGFEGDVALDEEQLRDMVAEIVREELQGELGERITRNVRKLVRREINRALAGQDLI